MSKAPALPSKLPFASLRPGRIIAWTLLFIGGVIMVTPLLYMFATSLKTPAQVYDLRLIPAAPTLENYITILADGGVRSGLDLVRMLALGANGVLIGRAFIYALAAAGEQGVTHVLDLIAAEMRVAMALSGVTQVNQIGPEILAGG